MGVENRPAFPDVLRGLGGGPENVEQDSNRLETRRPIGVDTRTRADIVRSVEGQGAPRQAHQMTTLYHGTRNESLVPHLGLCLTPSDRAAEHYATSRGEVHEVAVDLSGLRVVEVATGDRDSQSYAGDADLSGYAADVIRYADEDTHGYQHETYRIVSEAALARVAAAIAALV